MCGIFGIYHSNTDKKVDQSLVRKATDEMMHRGPDEGGYFVSGNIGLGHRRLSIIDLSSGHQPMFNEDGQVAVVYNGEIYNYKDIQKELKLKGHIFKTNCDTEVIVHAYEEWGAESVKRFIGMFAFILWDERKKAAWIVRDRLGIKPLYYCWDGESFICSSEVKPLLSTGLVKPEINEKVVDAYCTLGYVPGPETMFKNIRKLRPGHFIFLSGNQCREQEYWDFANIEQSEISFDQAQVKVQELIYDSVNKRLMSDVPLGVFLSGGLDSSAVTAIMHDLVKDPINTFTVGYDKKFKVGEEYYADIVARQFETKHSVFQLQPENFFSSIEALVNFAEEPIVEPAAIALYHISKLAREKAIVLLSGEGSDEVFGGYYLYQFMNKIESIQKYLPMPVMKAAGFSGSFFSNRKYRKYIDDIFLMRNLSEIG
jgi:asparagine synthase (glutamine-hydrolysing)